MIRKHRDEKEMTAYLVVDVSTSMAYKSGDLESKGWRAARIAAVLAALMQRQGDKFSLTLFNTYLDAHLPSGSTRRHLMDALFTLEGRMVKPTGLTKADSALNLCGTALQTPGERDYYLRFPNGSRQVFHCRCAVSASWI